LYLFITTHKILYNKKVYTPLYKFHGKVCRVVKKKKSLCVLVFCVFFFFFFFEECRFILNTLHNFVKETLQC